MQTAALPENKRCVICGMDIPEQARKCTHCDQWQGLIPRLFSEHLRDLVALIPIVTLSVAFLGQLDLLWRADLDAFGLRCTSLNTSGALRRYDGETLVISAKSEPVFLGKAALQGADGIRHPTQATVYDGDSATQLVSSTPIRFKIDAKEEVVKAICADNREQFDVTVQVLSLERVVETLRIGSCLC